MSTIVISNIKATGETASRAVSGVAAAWVNFNGTGTVAIRDSNNVASLTDNGVGVFTISYSNSMANSNYSGSSGVTTSSAFSQGSFRFGGDSRGITYSTTSLKLVSVNSNSTVDLDCDYCSASIHGDLA